MSSKSVTVVLGLRIIKPWRDLVTAHFEVGGDHFEVGGDHLQADGDFFQVDVNQCSIVTPRL